MAKFFYIIPLILVSLACGMSVPAENALGVNKDIHINTEVNSVEMVVIADTALNIRADHTEQSDDIGDLFYGDVVTCELPFTVVGDSTWCLHERGWSNVRWLEVR